MFTGTIIGNLGADAEVRDSNGQKFVSLSIGETRKFKKADGSEITETNWFDATINNADHPVLPYLKQGVKVCVQGDVSLRVYSSKKDRMMKAGATIRVQKIELCGGSSDDVPRRLIDPDTAVIYETKKYYWIPYDTKSLKKGDVKGLVDERGRQFMMDDKGFVEPVPEECQPQKGEG